MNEARYDGLSDWYDDFNAPAALGHQVELAELLGPGAGPCLDLGCGTGLYFDAIRRTGRTVIGLDRSADQLRLATARGSELVQADAGALPFVEGSFGAVVALWVSTDVDDLPAVLTEAARVLRPGGRLVFYGVHPCFNGPCIEDREDGARIIHPTYRNAGWHQTAPWWKPGGIRSRLGMRHVPLADLLNAFLTAGLTIDKAVEPRQDPLPYALALRAKKPV